MGACNKVFVAYHNRAHGGAQAFGEAEHHRVHCACQGTDRHAEGDGGVEDAGPIHMHCHPVSVCQAGERFDLLYAEHHTTTVVMGVFNAEEGGWSRVFITAVADVYLDLAWVEHTVIHRRHDTHWRTTEGRGSSYLKVVDMRAVAEDNCLASSRMSQHRGSI